MTTTETTSPVPTSNEHVAVDPAAISDLPNSSLLERLRAELAAVETRVSAVVHTIGDDVRAVLAEIRSVTASAAQAAKPPAAPAARAAIAGPSKVPVAKPAPARPTAGVRFRDRV